MSDLVRSAVTVAMVWPAPLIASLAGPHRTGLLLTESKPGEPGDRDEIQACLPIGDPALLRTGV